MVQKKILEVVEIIEDITAKRIGDGNSCEITCEEVVNASGIAAAKFDFDQICLYALNEFVETKDTNGDEVRILLYTEAICDGKGIKVTINEDARGYFDMLRSRA